MGQIFTLDSYREAAEEKYGSFEIQISKTVSTHLYNPLRIDEKKRNRVFEIIEELEPEKKEAQDGKWQEVGGDDDGMSMKDVAKMHPLLVEFILLVGDDNTQKLIDQVGHDITILLAIFQDYFKAVGLGEASTSEE